MFPRPSARVTARQARDRILRERVHDPYEHRSKLPEPTVCPGCGVVYRAGRWQWSARPPEAHETRCPACLRTRDDYPGGTVTIAGPFWRAHEQDILGLIRNVEARQSAEHPLQRIMSVGSEDGRLIVKTTDMHLARAIGQALSDAHEGELHYRYPEETAFLKVLWRR